MHKLLILDDTPKVEILIKNILESDGDKFDIRKGTDKIGTDIALKEQNPEMLIVNTDSSKAVSVYTALDKKTECPPAVFIGKNLAVKPKELNKIKAVDEIALPFVPEEFCLRMDDDIYKALGKFDELTGLFKKSWFDHKMEKLMRKRVKGTMFCMSPDAYSFAANPPTQLQRQMAAYALKSTFTEGILAVHGTMILGFFPSDRPRKENEKYLNSLIDVMCKAADEPKIYICAGAAESELCDYSAVDTYVYANKAMAQSLSAGKNCVRYYK